MKGAGNSRSCSGPDTIAAFAEGKLQHDEMVAVLAHIDGCPSCMADVKDANARLAEERARHPWWMALAAAAAVAVVTLIALPYLLRFRDPMRRLAALAPRSERPVESRLSGSFAWAPWRGPMRASDPASDAGRMKLIGMAGELVETADSKKTPDAQHAAGVALLLTDRAGDAISRLRDAAGHDPSNAALWSDLAAAQCAAALHDERPSLYPEALASVDRALQLDPRLGPALFNRALILERLALTGQARDAWERYLAVDPASPWADEARGHLAQLPRTTAAALFQHDVLRLDAGASADVDSLVKRYPQQTRAWAEAELLGRWGEAVAAGQTAAAEQQQALARRIGLALVRSTDERLLHDAVASIDSAGGAARARLAAAHVAYRRGRIAYSRQQPTAAATDLRQAAGEFRAAGSPMALVARYFAASTRFDENDVSGARADLETLLAEVDAAPGYHALGAQVRWELAVCLMAENDWDGARIVLGEASAAFARLGERSNEAMMEVLRADALVLAGRMNEGWTARIRAFGMESAEGRGDRLAVSISGSSRMEIRAGRTGPARALLHVEQEIDRADGHQELLCSALVREAIVSAESGSDDDAQRLVREARAIAGAVADPAIRARLTADVQFASGLALLRRQPKSAIAPLDEAIAHYTATSRVVFLPECYLARARAARALGDVTGARRAVESGISVLQQYRVQLAPSIRGSVIRDVGPSLHREAIRLDLDRGDIAGAFSSAERSRTGITGDGTPVTLPELQRRLAGSRAGVLRLAVLPDEVIALWATEGEQSVARRKIAQGELETLAGRVQDPADEDAAARLFELLISPLAHSLARVDRIIIIADPPLENVPFAALYDNRTRGYLIERVAVLRALNATSLRDEPAPRALRSVAAIALPAAPTAVRSALPAIEEELDEISRNYAQATRLGGAEATIAAVLSAAGGADVAHLAGHTERQPGIGESALILAGGRRLSWQSVVAARLASRPVVVLAACETLRVPQSAQSFALSLGGAFLDAGARDVVGTLAPVADNEARELFRSVHRHLTSGLDAASALRQAQLEALADRSPQRHMAWRVVTLLTSRIPRTRG